MSEVRVEMARGRAKSEKDYHWQPGEEGGRLWVSVDTHLVSCLPCSSGMALLMQVWRWLEGYGWGWYMMSAVRLRVQVARVACDGTRWYKMSKARVEMMAQVVWDVLV